MIDDLENSLNAKQREICLSQDNYLIMACPGSGKTRTLTYRVSDFMSCHQIAHIS